MKFLLSYIWLSIITACAESPSLDMVKLEKKVKEARVFVATKKFNTDFCILIDYSIHSGLPRMFVYDFKKDTIIYQAMVSHGCGDKTWAADETKTKPVFSNVPESHCSSLGKFKIGAQGISEWGIKINYKLHGLESSNSNAYKRFIVLHSWDAIPHESVYPQGTPEGYGCPAVSNTAMKYLHEKLKKSTKPVLLWGFE